MIDCYFFRTRGREEAEVRKTGNASSRCDDDGGGDGDGRMHACVRASASTQRIGAYRARPQIYRSVVGSRRK